MTAQTPTSAVEALRALVAEMQLTGGVGIPVKPECVLRWAERLARLSPPAPGGDAVRALVDEWADDDTPILRGDAAAELRAALKLAAAPTPPASQGDAAPAGDAVLISRKDAEHLARFGLNNAGDGLRAPVKHAAMRVQAALATAPAPAVEQEDGERDPADGEIYGVRFGMGAVGVSTGVYTGEPAVILRAPIVPGVIGTPFTEDERGPIRAVLLFPTEVQAKAVADALTTPPTPAADGNGGAVDAAIAELRKYERELRADGMDVHANTYAHAIGIIESSCHQPVAGEQGAVK